MSMTIFRHQAGAPASQGGEFRSAMRKEAALHLPDLSDAEYNAEGTFLFPPVARSAEQHIAFWMSVPVSDGILQNVSAAYEEASSSWRRFELYEFARRYDVEHGLNHTLADQGKEKPEKQAVRDAAIEAQEERLLDLHPARISAVYARGIARACRLWDFAGDLPEEEMEKAISTPVRIGPDMEATPSFIAERYLYERIDESFSEPQFAMARLLSALQNQIE